MKAKEKAKELVERYFNLLRVELGYSDTEKAIDIAKKLHWTDAKQCALICVDEMRKAELRRIESNYGYHLCDTYYKDLKQEIENL